MKGNDLKYFLKEAGDVIVNFNELLIKHHITNAKDFISPIIAENKLCLIVDYDFVNFHLDALKDNRQEIAS